MSIQLINIGFGNMVSANRIIAVISPESAPVRCYHHRQQPCNLVGDTAGNSRKSV